MAFSDIVDHPNFSERNAEGLVSILKYWRKRTSDELQIPAYRVLTNKVIDLIAEKRPRTLLDFRTLSGIGDSKTGKFGPKIVEMVKSYESGQQLEDFRSEYISLSAEDEKYLSTLESDILLEKKKKLVNEKNRLKEAKKKSKKSGSAIVMSKEQLREEAKHHDGVIAWEELNSEQQHAAKQALMGKNVFITGSAGTGKTFLLKYIIQELIAQHGADFVAITAPTGIAAINLGGQTINRLSRFNCAIC